MASKLVLNVNALIPNMCICVCECVGDALFLLSLAVNVYYTFTFKTFSPKDHHLAAEGDDNNLCYSCML
jgi:hypothetical protein